MTSTEPLDFFVSYTACDESWAEWIAFQLEAEGYRTRLQKWDFRPGANFILEMQNASIRAARTVVVLSPAYLDSRYGAAEWAAAFVDAPRGELLKVLPVRIADFRPPGLLRAIVYIDLFDKNEDAATKALLAGVLHGRAKTDAVPRFPGAERHEQGPQRQAPVYPKTLPRTWTVPFQHNPYFMGRSQALETIEASFESTTSIVVVHGQAGVGKTQVAVEYAFAQRERYDAVLWIVAESPAAFEANLAALCDSKALRLPERAHLDQAVRMSAVLRWLHTHDRWLVICDSVDGELTAQSVLSRLSQLHGGGHIIITSRLARWPITIALVEVTTWPVPLAAEFLAHRVARSMSFSGSISDAQDLAKELAGLPLALEHAAAYIEQKRLSLAEYVKRVKKSARVLEHVAEGATKYKASVSSTWFVTVADLTPAARAVLTLSAFLAPVEVPRSLFVRAGDLFLDAVDSSSADRSSAADVETVADDALSQLADYSLITLTPSTFTCHPLLMIVQRERLQPDERRHQLELVMRLVRAVLPSNTDDINTWPSWDPLASHVAHAVSEADALNIVAPTASLMQDLAVLLMTRARFEQAERFMRRALAIDEAIYGQDHPGIVAHLTNLATLLQQTNRPHPAEQLARRALSIAEKYFGPQHSGVAQLLNNLANVLMALDRRQEAEPLLRRALTVAESSADPSDPMLAIHLNSLAQLLTAQMRLRDAEPLLRRALAIDEAARGSDHPKVAIRLNNLALLLLKDTAKRQQAVPLLRRALAIDEAAFGPDHPAVGIDLNNLAQVLLDANLVHDAEPLMRRALAIAEASAGPTHPSVAIRLTSLAQLLQATNQEQQAEPLLRRALEITEASFDADHSNRSIALNNLAELLRETHRTREAEPLMRRALAIVEQSFGPNHPEVATVLGNIALLLIDSKRREEAEPLMRRALAIDRAAFGSHHLNVARDLYHLATLLAETNRVQEAKPLARRALEILEASLGPTHPKTELVRHFVQRLQRR